MNERIIGLCYNRSLYGWKWMSLLTMDFNLQLVISPSVKSSLFRLKFSLRLFHFSHMIWSSLGGFDLICQPTTQKPEKFKLCQLKRVWKRLMVSVLVDALQWSCILLQFPFVLTACQLVVCWPRGRGEDMELSDGLLLQVNNGEQGANRWKQPSDDSVSTRLYQTGITGRAICKNMIVCFSLPLFCPPCVWMCDQDRSCSPSVLRCVASTWKEGLLNRKRPFVGRCCHSCTPQSQVKWHHVTKRGTPTRISWESSRCTFFLGVKRW